MNTLLKNCREYPYGSVGPGGGGAHHRHEGARKLSVSRKAVEAVRVRHPTHQKANRLLDAISSK